MPRDNQGAQMKYHHKMQRCKKMILATVFLLGSAGAIAYTECTLNLTRIYAGDNGYVWLYYDNAGSAYVMPNDPDIKNILALATTALIGSKSIIVRYDANAVACSTLGRGDVAGIYLLK